MARPTAETARGIARALAALVVGALGCDPAKPPLEPPPATKAEVIGAINRNTEALDFQIKATGSAVADVVEDGRAKTYQLTAILIYRRPRGLFLKLEHTVGSVEINVGSNDTFFWLWDMTSSEQERWRYLTGRHDRMRENADADVLLRPDHLPEVLGLLTVPGRPQVPQGPYFRETSGGFELLYVDQDVTGVWYITKSVRIPKAPPWLPADIVIYGSDGQPVMLATLSNYEPVRDSDVQVLLPHLIDMHWPEPESSLRLDFGAIRRFDNPRTYEELIRKTPLEKHGAEGVGIIEWIDQPRLPFPPPESPSTAPGEP